MSQRRKNKAGKASKTKGKRAVVPAKYFDLGPSEKGNHHEIRVEAIDAKYGIMRARVVDQTNIDKLALLGVITAEQRDAGISFQKTLSRAGAFVRAFSAEPSPSSGIFGISDRQMARSGLAGPMLGVLKRELGSRNANITYRVILDEKWPVHSELDGLRRGLDVLISYFEERKMPKRKPLLLAS